MVICKIVGDNSWDFSPIYVEVPDAPSIEEIVQVLLKAGDQGHSCMSEGLQIQIDNLIQRLEGT